MGRFFTQEDDYGEFHLAIKKQNYKQMKKYYIDLHFSTFSSTLSIF